MTISKQIREKLVSQSLGEVEFSYNYKQARISSWNKNEDMYYGKKEISTETRANVSLGKMQGFVHTLLSKIDSPLTFKYIKGESSDLKKTKLMNALKEKDAKVGRWNFKDLLGKKAAIIYGRVINLYFADSKDGVYKSNLERIDSKDFLIDPDAGGMDIEKAMYLGWWNTKITKQQLEAGVKSGIYIKEEVDALLAGGGNNTTQTRQDIDKRNRFAAIANTFRERFKKRSDQWKFYTWITTSEDDGQRYYLIFTPAGQCVRCELWQDIQADDKYPIWTWAAFPDEYEFWTPSYCDYVREIFMAQEISINQMLDNGEQINKPQVAVNVDYIRNLSQVKYRKDSYIEVEGNVDINRVLQSRITPSITTAVDVYNVLDKIVQSESGVTADAKGTSEEDTLGIYEGNLQQAGDRFGLLNKSYSDGYYRFAQLYKSGVMQHLKKKTAVEILGPMGLEIEYVTARTLKPYKEDYDILIESSIAEAQSNLADSKNKLTFLGAYKGDPTVNQKTLFETQASISGLEEDMIKRLLDTSEYGEISILSEADETFQKLIGGETVRFYKYANTAFMQRLVDLSDRYDHELTPAQHQAVFDYITAIQPIVEKNMARALADQAAKAGNMDSMATAGGANANVGQDLANPEDVNGAMPVDQASENQAISTFNQ